MRQFSDQITPREYETWNHDKEMLELQMNHATEMKKLELEVLKLEAKWSSWIKIPLYIIMLPVRFIMAFAIPISVITKTKLPKSYWRFMK